MIDSTREVCKITAIVMKGMAADIMEALMAQGVFSFYLSAGRAVVLHVRKGLLGLGAGYYLSDEPVEVFMFLVPLDMEEHTLDFIMHKGSLDAPGHGSVHGERVELLQAHDLCHVNRPELSKPERTYRRDTEVQGICCIVQRGEGEVLARAALDIGACVPTITFGTGTGVRDKLGLLRITIPAEKDIVSLVADNQDAEDVMNLLIDKGKLEYPGKGFIYQYPMTQGHANKRMIRGTPKHAASMEQIIAAIDHQHNSTVWRRRSGAITKEDSSRKYLTDLTDLTLMCNEGQSEKLVKAAMGVGAAGATIAKQKHICPADKDHMKISPARESCSMIVSKKQIPAILTALTENGAFRDEAHGLVMARPAPRACTYLGG
jgi:hypothetical protein